MSTRLYPLLPSCGLCVVRPLTLKGSRLPIATGVSGRIGFEKQWASELLLYCLLVHISVVSYRIFRPLWCGRRYSKGLSVQTDIKDSLSPTGIQLFSSSLSVVVVSAFYISYTLHPPSTSSTSIFPPYIFLPFGLRFS